MSSLKEANKIIITLSGEPKSGKTHFCLTAPEPIEFFDFDGGVVSLVSKFPNKDIRLHQCLIDVWGIEKVTPLWESFLKDYKAALAGDAKTIVVDTATQLWEVLRMAHLERVQKESPKERVKLQPVEYSQPNAIMRSVIAAPRANNKHSVLTHYIREVWDGEGKRTGIFEADQFKHTEGLADVILRFDAKRIKPTGEKTIITIARCRDARELVGIALPDNAGWQQLEMLLEV